MTDPTERFSDRAHDYARYRPSYPGELIELMRVEMGLQEDHTLADIGSGTGILASLFLAHGNAVFGVEPNRAMREVAETSLGGKQKFTSVDGSAERTGLPDGSVDFVTAGQAFHWFEPEAAATEFRRILRPSGWVVLIWNNRRPYETAFLEAYEAFLCRWGTDYGSVRTSYVVNTALASVFTRGYSLASFANIQVLNRAGLRGRLISSSYAPDSDHPDREPMLEALDLLFDRYQADGSVRIEYDADVYYGQL